MSNSNDVLNFLNTKKQVITLNGKEYKVNQSYKHTIYLNARRKELAKMEKEAEDKGEIFNEAEENFKLIFDVLKLSVGEDFVKEVEKLELGELDLIKIFRIVNLMRGGKTQEQAIEEIEKEDEEEEKN